MNFILKKIDTILVGIATMAIRFYRRWLFLFFPTGRCIYKPSCSEYCLECLKKHGLLKGTGLCLSRIARCNPSADPKEDPVP